jgi:hypothetical protein
MVFMLWFGPDSSDETFLAGSSRASVFMVFMLRFGPDSSDETSLAESSRASVLWCLCYGLAPVLVTRPL